MIAAAWDQLPAWAAGVVVRAPRMVAVIPTLREVPHEPGTPAREATAYLLALPHGALLLLLVASATNTTAQTFQRFRRARGNLGGVQAAWRWASTGGAGAHTAVPMPAIASASRVRARSAASPVR